MRGESTGDALVVTLSDLEHTLGYSFQDKTLLQNALTHTSYANERFRENQHLKSNERLEFVGDAVLGLVAGGYIYRKYPQMPEGQMSKLRARVVCEATLAELALRLQIDRFLRLGIGEEQTGGRRKPSLLADAMESLIGAVYLEAGFEEANRILLLHLAPEIDRQADEPVGSDYKSRLQELLGKKRMTVSYEIVSEEGPDHDRTFTACATTGDGRSANGTGHSKKEAEQAAAKAILEQAASFSG